MHELAPHRTSEWARSLHDVLRAMSFARPRRCPLLAGLSDVGAEVRADKNREALRVPKTAASGWSKSSKMWKEDREHAERNMQMGITGPEF